MPIKRLSACATQRELLYLANPFIIPACLILIFNQGHLCQMVVTAVLSRSCPVFLCRDCEGNHCSRWFQCIDIGCQLCT